MAKQGLVTLVTEADLVWDRIETGSGAFRIARPITSRNCPTMGGGIGEMTASELAWTLNYDEIITVLEGELTVLHNGEAFTARAGEMFLIRHGADVVYKAQGRCRFSWAVSPANWREVRWTQEGRRV